MPDFRVSDERAEDDQLDAAGLAAAGLFALAGAYAMRELTDGWVPERYVRSRRGGPAAARRLVDVGKWVRAERDGVPGFQYTPEAWKEQRSAAEIVEAREATAARMRSLRRRQKDQLVRDSGQLTTGLLSVGAPTPDEPDDDLPDDHSDDTSDEPRDPVRDASRDPVHDTERARLPPPHPLPSSGQEGEARSRSERDAPAPARPAPTLPTPSYPQVPSPSRLVAVRSLSHPLIDGLPRPALEALDPRCSVHAQAEPGTPTPACRDCAVRRRAIADAMGRAAAGDVADRRASRDLAAARVQACPDCDTHSWLLGTDGTPVDPATRCTHPRIPDPAAEHGAGPTREAR